jgi:hypothetical protein
VTSTLPRWRMLLRVVMVALAAALMAFYGRPRFGPESFAGRSLAEIEQPRRDCPSGTQESPSTGECVPSARRLRARCRRPSRRYPW